MLPHNAHKLLMQVYRQRSQRQDLLEVSGRLRTPDQSSLSLKHQVDEELGQTQPYLLLFSAWCVCVSVSVCECECECVCVR